MSEYVLVRIEALQQELESLRKLIARSAESHKRKTKLKGLWKGVEINEGDLEEAKRAVFENAYQF